MDKDEQNTSNPANWLSIGEAAKLLRVSKDTLRRWEKKGIIKPHRSPTNRRYYKKESLDYIFSKKPDLKATPLKTPSSAKKESRLPLIAVGLLSLYVILMLFLAWLLLRAG